MSRIFTPAADAAASGHCARVKKTAGSLLEIMKANGLVFLLAGAIVATLPQYAIAQSFDRIEGGRPIQIMPVPQSLGIYNGAAVSTGRLRADRTSPARRTRLAPGKVQRRR